MKIRAKDLQVGDKIHGHEVLAIARGIGMIWVTTSYSRPDEWFDNDEKIEVER